MLSAFGDSGSQSSHLAMPYFEGYALWIIGVSTLGTWPRSFDASLLTIAHRLVTVADYDKVWPMQNNAGKRKSLPSEKDGLMTRSYIESNVFHIDLRCSVTCINMLRNNIVFHGDSHKTTSKA